MAINRWVGQAVAVREECYFVPSSVRPGAIFQLTDGVRKNRYVYPTQRLEEDVVDADLAYRVCQGLVSAASSSEGLSGGTNGSEMTYEVSTYKGVPAIRVLGGSLGQPVSLVASASPASSTPITVTQLQEGSVGKDFVFTMRWPVAPTNGNWFMASSGKRPVRMEYNATASQVRTALLTFDLPCSSINVTGDYVAGYRVRLITLNDPITELPVMFPVIAGDDNTWMQGVDKNAGYKVTTVQRPGIRNQQSGVPLLDGDPASLYRFKYNGEYSNYFVGSSSLKMIEDAAVAIFGAGNVSVGGRTSEYSALLNFGGYLSERVVLASIEKYGSEEGGIDLQITKASDTPGELWELRYEFTGGVCGGTWSFVDTVAPATTIDFLWRSPVAITPTMIHQTLATLNPGYGVMIKVSDISVVTEQFGEEYILREFTIKWDARIASQQTGFSPPTFIIGRGDHWLALDTSKLRVCTPLTAIESYGKLASKEIQLISIDNDPTSGSFNLRYGNVTTDPLPHNATALQVELAIESATGLSVNVIGADSGPYRVRFESFASRLRLSGFSTSLAIEEVPLIERFDVTAGTGPSHADNPDNWSLGRLHNADDVMVFSDGSVGCLYGTNLSIPPARIDIYRGYTGSIGLPEIRSDGSVETLQRHLSFNGSVDTPCMVRVGIGNTGEGPSIVRLDFRLNRFDTNVNYTQARGTAKVLSVIGTHAQNKMSVNVGDVAIGVYPEDIANVASLQIVPSSEDADGVTFSTSSGATVQKAVITGGTSVFDKPPRHLLITGGITFVNGDGDTLTAEVANARLRWMASGTIGRSQVVDSVFFGPDLFGATQEPLSVRIVSAAHGLRTGDRVYIRSYSGVSGVDGKSFSVSVLDIDTFELLGALGSGTYEGFAGMMHWANERACVIRDGGVLDFDSDSGSRDIIAPIVLQGSALLLDSKVTVSDLRVWPERVTALDFFGTDVELKRTRR